LILSNAVHLSVPSTARGNVNRKFNYVRLKGRRPLQRQQRPAKESEWQLQNRHFSG